MSDTNSKFESAYLEAFNNPVTPDRFGDVMLIGDGRLSVRSLGSRMNRVAQGLVRMSVVSKYSHVAICLRPGLWLHAVPGAGVSIINFFEVWKYIREKGGKNVAIYRPDLSDEVLYKQMRASKFAFEVYNNPYTALYLIGHSNIFQKKFYQQKFFCSELVVRILQTIGFFPGLKAQRYLPVDVHKLCESQGWLRVEDQSLIGPLQDNQVQRFMSAGSARTGDVTAQLEAIMAENRGQPCYSTMQTLLFLKQTNDMLENSLNATARERMTKLLVEELSYELLKRNQSYLKSSSAIILGSDNSDRS